MRPKFQKCSVLKLAGRIIPYAKHIGISLLRSPVGLYSMFEPIFDLKDVIQGMHEVFKTWSLALILIENFVT
jgi:hypothetical protein